MNGLSLQWKVKLVTLKNRREHWGAKAARAKAHRSGACLRISNALNLIHWPKDALYLVKITRLGPRFLDADDNLNSSASHIRDGIADALGVNDGNTSRIRFKYAQEKCPEYGVRVEVDFR